MTTDTLHLGVRIARRAADVDALASVPTNLPRWAPGLGTQVEEADGQWFVVTPEGRATS